MQKVGQTGLKTWLFWRRVLAVAWLVASLGSGAWAGDYRLVMGDDPGDSCCNACCQVYQDARFWCRIERFFCRACGVACLAIAQQRYRDCAVQSYMDWPEYQTKCENTFGFWGRCPWGRFCF